MRVTGIGNPQSLLRQCSMTSTGPAASSLYLAQEHGANIEPVEKEHAWLLRDDQGARFCGMPYSIHVGTELGLPAQTHDMSMECENYLPAMDFLIPKIIRAELLIQHSQQKRGLR